MPCRSYSQMRRHVATCIYALPTLPQKRHKSYTNPLWAIEKNSIKTLKIIFVVLFALLSIGSLIASLYWIWLTAFGIGWAGGDTTILEIIWMSRGLILVFIYSAIATVGLIKPKNIGLIFGYAIVVGISVYFLTTSITFLISDLKNGNEISLKEIGSWIIGFIFTIGFPALFIIGLNKLKKGYLKLKIQGGIISGVLAISLFLTLYFTFD